MVGKAINGMVAMAAWWSRRQDWDFGLLRDSITGGLEIVAAASPTMVVCYSVASEAIGCYTVVGVDDIGDKSSSSSFDWDYGRAGRIDRGGWCGIPRSSRQQKLCVSTH